MTDYAKSVEQKPDQNISSSGCDRLTRNRLDVPQVMYKK